MDDIDTLFIRSLVLNSRLTYRELADMSDMSVSAVHKRIKNLEEEGTILAYIARPSQIALKYIWVTIFGTSNAKSMDVVSKELGLHEGVNMVCIMASKFLYIKVFLRDISYLQEYGSHIARVAQINEPNIGINNVTYMTTPEAFTSIDYKILKTLNRDARKPIVDIADSVGISAKTVRKRLNYMIENNLAQFTIEWAPAQENTYLTLFYLYLNEGMNLDSMVQHLTKKFSQQLQYCFTYSNIPNLILLITTTKSSKETQGIQEELQTEGFKDVIPRVFFSITWYECWVDELLRAK
jgi:Lrp/AsnC family transcriptional regulator for asnA, asnC and gidA